MNALLLVITSGHWGEYFDPPLEHNGRPVRGQGYVADDFTTHALEFIERNRERPFLCYVPFNTPHSPWTVPEAYWRSRAARARARSTFRLAYPSWPRVFNVGFRVGWENEVEPARPAQ